MKALLETWAASNARFEKLLKGLYEDHGEPQSRLFQAMAYSLNAGGKRLRPFLVYQFCLACGGREEWLEADTVVAAFGIRADKAELDSLRDLVPETYVIGDAHKVGVIGDATNDAWRVCMQIE